MGNDNQGRFLRHFLGVQYAVRGYLMAVVGDFNSAEDLFQEIAAVLWTKFDQYDPARPFGAWALGVARLEVLKWRQRQARRREWASDEVLTLLADAAAEHAEEIDAMQEHLRRCLDKLEDHARAAVRLRYRDALPIRRIAERMGKTERAMEMILVRVRQVLRDCVERSMSEQTSHG